MAGPRRLPGAEILPTEPINPPGPPPRIGNVLAPCIGRAAGTNGELMIISIYCRLWEQLTDQEKAEACDAFWDPRHEAYAPLRAGALEHLSLVSAPVEELRRVPNRTLARRMPPLLREPLLWFLIEEVLEAWLHSRPGSMLNHIGRALGLVREAKEDETPATEECLRQALNRLKQQHPPRLLAVACLILLVKLQRFSYVKNLGAAVMAGGLDVFGIVTDMTSCPPEPEEAEAAAWTPVSLTATDEWLSRSIDAAASGQRDAPGADAMEAIVEEFIGLSTSRPQSYYHRGMFHASFGRPLQLHFPGEDEEKRLWYFCGALQGLHRKADLAGCLKLLEEQQDLQDALNLKRHLRCGDLVLPLIFRTFVSFGKVTEAARWLETHVGRLAEPEASRLLDEAHQVGVRQFQQGRVAEARAMFDAVTRASHRPQFRHRPVPFLALNELRRAEVKQYQKEFGPAEELFRSAVLEENEQVAGMALAGLGLVKGRFHSLSDVLPETSYEKTLAKCLALSRGEEQFNQAANGPEAGAARANVCLAVLSFLKVATAAISRASLSAQAASHFAAALPWMLLHQEDYGGEVIAWCRLMLSIALLETDAPNAVRDAGQHLEDALGSGIAIPPWIYQRALAATMVLDDPSLAERLAGSLLQANPKKTYEILWETEIARTNSIIRGRYLKWLGTESRMPEAAQFGQLQTLLKAALKDGEVEQAKDSLQRLERLAVENGACRMSFVELLKDAANYSPAWKTRDAETRLAELYELAGDLAGAAEVLKRRIRHLLHEGQEHHLVEAGDLLARAEEYHLPDPDLAEIRKKLTGSSAPVAPESAMDELQGSKRPVRVLYVGGNETQRAYEKAMRAELAQQSPSLMLDFVYPGWNSNWNKHLEVVTRLIPEADVVVLSHLVHTEFGERVRAACGSHHPYLPCGGRGKAAIKRSILRAALWACRRKQAALTAKDGKLACPPPAPTEIQLGS